MIVALGVSLTLLSCQKETASVEETIASSMANSNKNSENSIPFIGNYVTTAEFFGGPAVQRITGRGQATHLGESVFIANATVNFGVPPPFPLQGTATFTAANGDQFFTQFSGFNTPTGPGTSRGDITHTIVGGNGRFANATGTLIGIAFVTVGNPTNTVSYTGTINY